VKRNGSKNAATLMNCFGLCQFQREWKRKKKSQKSKQKKKKQKKLRNVKKKKNRDVRILKNAEKQVP